MISIFREPLFVGLAFFGNFAAASAQQGWHGFGDNGIAFANEARIAGDAAAVVQQKGRKVSGSVIDETGEPVIGANIVEKGNPANGTVTDMDGRFSINVSDDAVLVISYIGYDSQEIKVGRQAYVSVALSENTEILDEVVVVGYGTQKKASLTGSVASVSSKELVSAPMQNVSNLLTGKVPGLTSIQSSGRPGEDNTSLYIRGLNAFSDNGPLIVVDGVERQMSFLNPNDIESISVLKDASAAIYGVQGANGVVLITTKSGGEGPAKISYDGSATMTQNTAMPEFLNASDFMYYHNMAREMDGLTPLWTADIQNKVLANDGSSVWGQTDWFDMIFRTGITQQHTVSANGGTEKTKYAASLGYMDQEGTLINTGLARYNARVNLDVEVAKNLRFTAGISGYRYDKKYPGYGTGNQAEFSPIRQAADAIPIIRSEYKGYAMTWINGSYAVNPYDGAMNSGFSNTTNWTINTNYKLEYDFGGLSGALEGLKASVFAAYDYDNTLYESFLNAHEVMYVNSSLDEGVTNASGIGSNSSYNKSQSIGSKWLLRPQLSYSRSFGAHDVGLLLFYEAQKHSSNTMTGYKQGYYTNDPIDISLGTEFGTTPVTGSHSYSGQASYAGRLNYGYADKYLAELAFRRDGSYVFAPENRWGFFPSASLGWVVSEEGFFKNNVPAIEYLKIRASYGESGNDNVTAYLYNSSYGVSANSMVFGGKSVAQFYSSNTYIYRNLTWSTTHSYNVGLDVSLLRQKLAIELDAFYQLTEGILESSSGSYPTSLGGYYPSYENSGKVDNRGFEVAVKHRNRIGRDWSYNVSGSFSFARNKVLSKKVSDNYPNYRAVLGEPMNARYGFKALGFFQTQEELDDYPAAPSGMVRLGDLKYLDVNGDGIISSEYDYVKTGYGSVPEINFSLNMDISYRDFYVNMLWQGVTHCDYELSGVYDSGVTASTVYTSALSGNSPYYRVLGAWREDNAATAEYPRLSTVSNGNNAWRSTWWVVNGEYLRLKSLNFGYNIPEKILQKTPLSAANIYIAGTNLLTFSHFEYVDPESPSVSNGYYPQQKTYSLGLKATF